MNRSSWIFIFAGTLLSLSGSSGNAKVSHPSIEDLQNLLGYKSSKSFESDYTLLKKLVKKGEVSANWKKNCNKNYPIAFCFTLNKYLKTTGAKKKKRSRSKRTRVAINSKNLAHLQKEDYRSLVRRFGNHSRKRLLKWSEISLKEKSCPRNLSLVLADSLEESLDRDWEHVSGLYEHGLECQQKDKSWMEYIHMHYGLLLLSYKNYSQALNSFNHALKVEGARESYRSLYWKLQCHQKLGQSKRAKLTARRLVSEFPRSWFSILANHEMKLGHIKNIKSRAPRFFEYKLEGDQIKNYPLYWLQVLLKRETNLRPYDPLLSKIVVDYPFPENPGYIKYLSLVLNQRGIYRLGIYALTQMNFKKPEELNFEQLKIIYPLVYLLTIKKHSRDLDPSLILSLIRQESAFNEKALSSAGAKGLMQLLSSTARNLDRQKARRLYHHDPNINLGVRYLSKMNSRFNGQIEKALSAYNAGYSKVRKWEKQYAHVDDPHLFLSLIPYRETRNYAISIFRNIYWYRTLYPALRNKAEQSSLGMKLSTIFNHHSSNQKKVSAVTYPEKIVKSIEYQTHPKKSSVTSETSGP